MRLFKEWKQRLQAIQAPPSLELQDSKAGPPTVRADGVYLHSRYNPVEEAARFIDSANLEPERPVLVVGLGLGYHVAELLRRGYEVAVAEPGEGVAGLAYEGPAADLDFLFGVGGVGEFSSSAAFVELCKKLPQILVHPPTARLHPAYIEEVEQAVGAAQLKGQRMSIAVVGPMYGGSLPIAGYLANAFESLGHNTVFIDASSAWPLYQEIDRSVESPHATKQLTNGFVNVLAEWTYARVIQFAPEICIVLAQAPVSPEFPERLRKRGIVSAFWFVENWRHMDYWRSVAPAYDFFFHIQPGEFEQRLTSAGCSHHAYVQTGCDPDVHRPVTLTEEEKAEYAADISFAGAGYPNRNQLFAGLTDYDLKLWGVNWTGRDLQARVCRPEERFTPETFNKIVAATKINLNLHSSTAHPGVDPQCDAINPRVFEIAAAGGFQLCDPCQGLASFFDFKTELPVYRDLAELRRLIDHYLAHPEDREAITQCARERALRDHTYVQRAEAMLNAILSAYGHQIAARGVRVQYSMSAMADKVGRTTPLGEYLSSLPPDVVFTQENINKLLSTRRGSFSFPEAVFMYLRDLRNTAEQLITTHDFGPGN